MSTTDELVVAAEHNRLRSPGPLPAPPARRVAIVTCMDARIDPAVIFGLAPGDAHVLRNAGGAVTDDDFRSAIERETGRRPPWSSEAFADLDTDVRESMRRVRSSPFVPHREAVRGFVYDVADGSVREVR